MAEGLDLDATRAMLRHVAEVVIANEPALTKADQAIGDGDHGVGMSRGFRAVIAALDAGRPAATAGDLLQVTATAILTKAGGASGAIFGTFFSGAAKGAGGAVLSAALFGRALREGLRAVQARGQAKPGDKTMVDALAPAADAAEASAAAGLRAAAQAAAEAAAEGARATQGMVAKVGKARALGERSVDRIDPGALTMSLILRGMAESITRVSPDAEPDG